MFFTLLKDFLSLQLIIYQSIRSLFRLFNECAADIDTLVAEHLQRELDSPIFGFAQTSVSQLSDELSLRTDSWFHYEVESAIRQLRAMPCERNPSTLFLTPSFSGENMKHLPSS